MARRHSVPIVNYPSQSDLQNQRSNVCLREMSDLVQASIGKAAKSKHRFRRSLRHSQLAFSRD